MKRAAALLLCTVPLLGGCAAAAIPVLATAIVGKKQIDGPKEKETPPPPKDQRVAVFVGEEVPKANLTPTAVTRADAVAAAAPAGPRLYTVTDLQPAAPAARLETTSVTKGVATAPIPAPTPVTLPPAALVNTPPPATQPAPGPIAAAPVAAPVVKAEVPAPAPALVSKPKVARPVQTGPAPLPASVSANGYTGLTAYVLPRVSSPESTGVLDVIDPRDPLTDPRRSQCGGLPPAVMVDLDPGLAVFDPSHNEAQSGLADALAALRGAGVTVLWSSALPVERAEEVHAALSRARLDPDRTDRLLLLNGQGDRKQARRLSAARNWCVIAMAGDRRGDFDEAFDYLKDPDTRIPADKLFDNGWFLAPAPIP